MDAEDAEVNYDDRGGYMERKKSKLIAQYQQDASNSSGIRSYLFF